MSLSNIFKKMLLYVRYFQNHQASFGCIKCKCVEGVKVRGLGIFWVGGFKVGVDHMGGGGGGVKKTIYTYDYKRALFTRLAHHFT